MIYEFLTVAISMFLVVELFSTMFYIGIKIARAFFYKANYKKMTDDEWAEFMNQWDF